MVLRTFSKAYGLAGLRVGYGIADAKVIDALDRIREPFNVNSVAQESALAALDDAEFVNMVVTQNKKMLEYLDQQFKQLGLETIPSVSNSVMVQVGPRSNDIFHGLMKLGYIVRTGDVFGMPEWLRVTTGTPAQCEGFVAALRQTLSDIGVGV